MPPRTGIAASASRWLTRAFVPGSVDPRPRRLAVAVLLVAGLAFWAWFFQGLQAMDFEDWPKERVYLDVLREAIAGRRIPLRTDLELQWTDRFLANPEPMLAPHVLLLPAVGNSGFVTIHVGLMFALGLAGCWQLARRFDWSAFAFAACATLFGANGFITSHLAIGHLVFAGYFLCPWVLWAAIRVVDAPHSARRIIELSWLLSALLLVGAFHFAVWWAWFLVFTILWRPSLAGPLALAAAVGAALCLGRIGPAAVVYRGLGDWFLTGYPTLTVLVTAFAASRGYATMPVDGLRATLGWWEFDQFVGPLALLFVCVLAARAWMDRDADGGLKRLLLVGALGVGALSLWGLYLPVTRLPIPLVSSERVSTRFISIAFFVSLVVACGRFDRDARTLTAGWRAAALAALGTTAAWLVLHAASWRPGPIEAALPPSSRWPDAATMTARIVTRPDDAVYAGLVAASWAISAAGLLASIAWWRRAARREAAGVTG